MNLFLTVRIALWALAKNKLRAGLTMLGIIIGIASVTTMVSLGGSASELVNSQLQSLGTNVIVVMPANRRAGVRDTAMHNLTAKDSDAIARECSSVLASTAIVASGGQLIYGNTNWKPNDMFGVGADYLLVRNWQLQAGEFFTPRDVSAATKVCVIGQTVAAKLFQTTDPLGQVIRVRNIPCKVIGVLERKGANMIGDDQDNIILLPLMTVRKRIQGSTFEGVNAIMVSGRTPALMEDAAEQIRRLLMERHHIHPGEPIDFQVQNTTEIANTLGIVTGAMTLMLSSVAAISLVVGGVGIMNIMLVSVTERTREIGIRMAIGAKSKDILRQFLVESIILATIGGIIGVVAGIGASVGLTMTINAVTRGSRWPIVVSLPAAGVALLFAGAVGLFFGYYPARRASRMDPIEALRFE
jgi:putative ABC transport system permease protein